MPTKERLQREKELAIERAEKAAELRKLENSITPEIRLRITSRSASPLNENLKTDFPALDYKGIQFEPDGEASLSPAHGRGGNDLRADDKKDNIECLKKKYPQYWDKRNGAKEIARKEGLNEETVRRYFREDRKTKIL